jgi:hypothetical protein
VTEPDAAPETGDPRVDAALAALDETDDRPPADRIEAFEAVHGTLQETLRGIEEV